MKQHKITFMALMLLSSAIISYPKNTHAFITTDISEAAGRIAATVGDVLRIGGINLEKGENQSTAEQTGEGTKETEAYIEKINNSINGQSSAEETSSSSSTSGGDENQSSSSNEKDKNSKKQNSSKLWGSKITGWATDFAKKRLKTGNPDKQKIRDNALRIAEVEAEILELNLRLTLAETERTLYYNIVERAYQEKLAAYEANKQKILMETQKLNVLALGEQKLAEYKAKLKAEFDAKLGDKLKETNDKIAKAGAAYENAKAAIKAANEQQQKSLQQELAIAQANYTEVENELEDLLIQLEEEKALHKDTTALEKQIKEKTEEYHQLEKQLAEIPEKQKKAEENALADINNALSDFEVEKESWLKKYAEAQAFLEVEMQEKLASFSDSILGFDVNNSADKRGALEDQMAELQKKIDEAKTKGEDTATIQKKIDEAKAKGEDTTVLQQQFDEAKDNGRDTLAMQEEMDALIKKHNSIEEVSVQSLLDGSFAYDKASDVLGAMEDGIATALDDVLTLKASYEDKLAIRIADIHNQIRTLRELRAQLQAQLAEQTAKYLIKSLTGIDLDNPSNALYQAMGLNYLNKDIPESAEAIDEIRRNRFIERRDAILSSYSDAVMLKLRIGDDMDIIEHFANNTDSMDTVSGVVGADTDIKIKTIEALMQYAELLVAELRLETATELALLNTYKVKNPDKDITNFNLDDYIYNCTMD